MYQFLQSNKRNYGTLAAKQAETQQWDSLFVLTKLANTEWSLVKEAESIP